MDVIGIDRDREARRHLWFGLKRMPPAERVRFLRHACGESVRAKVGAKVKKGHSGTTGEVYNDLMQLNTVYGACLSRVCGLLETWLRKRGVPSH